MRYIVFEGETWKVKRRNGTPLTRQRYLSRGLLSPRMLGGTVGKR